MGNNANRPLKMSNKSHTSFFKAVSSGVEVFLDMNERELIENLSSQLHSLLLEDKNPDLKRLYPVTYLNDPDKEADFVALVRDDLLLSRVEAVETVSRTINNRLITYKEFDAWISTLTSLRLVLGTRLDISEDDFFDPNQDDAPSRALLAWLGYLLEESINTAKELLSTNTE